MQRDLHINYDDDMTALGNVLHAVVRLFLECFLDVFFVLLINVIHVI